MDQYNYKKFIMNCKIYERLQKLDLTTRKNLINQADEEIRTLDPLLGKEMLYH